MRASNSWLEFAQDSFGLYTGTLAGFLFGKALGLASIQLVFPITFVFVAAMGYFRSRHDGRGRFASLRRAMILMATILASAVVATLFCDSSYDGRWYHQEGIIQLARGLDPWRDRLPEHFLPGGLWDLRASGYQITSAPTWINHYPKASEATAATVFALTGDIELGKLFAFLLLAGTASLIIGIFRQLRCGNLWVASAWALAVIASPVVLSQLWTYYNDAHLYLLFVGACGFLALHSATRWRGWLLSAALPLIALSNIKFTGPVFAAALCLAASAWAFVRWGRGPGLRTALFLAGAWIVSVVVVGYNPYVRNLLEDGHPFHPLMGAQRIEIIGRNAASGFESRNRLAKYIECTFAATSSAFHQVQGRIPTKIPFTASLDEFRAAADPDVRVAGFGPLHGGLLLVGLGFWIASLPRRLRAENRSFSWRIFRDDPTWGIDLLILTCLGSALINPQLWWARYAPQLWCVPLLCLMPRRRSGRETDSAPVAQRYAWVVAVATIVGSLPVFGFVLANNARNTLLIERDFSRLATTDSPIQVYFGQWTGDRLKYSDHRVPVIPKPFVDSLAGQFGDTLFYGGIIRHDSPQLEARLSKPGIDRSERSLVIRTYFEDRFLLPVKHLFLAREIP